MMRYILSLAAALCLLTLLSIVRSESGTGKDKPDKVWVHGVACMDARQMERFSRLRMINQAAHVALFTGEVNAEAGGQVCVADGYWVEEPVLIRKLRLSRWDVWIYSVKTQKGPRFMGLVGENDYEDL